jgi:hypothetical protein
MSDNGGEYINAAIAHFTSSKGIDPQHSVSYMPQWVSLEPQLQAASQDYSHAPDGQDG